MIDVRETAQIFQTAFREALAKPLLPVIWAIGSFICIAAGPFGTATDLDLISRLMFWPLAIGISVLVGGTVRTFVHRILRLPGPAAAQTMVSLLVTLFLSPILTGLAALFAEPWQHPPGLMQMSGYVLIISAAISALILAANAHERDAAQAAEEVPGPRLLARLGPDLHAPLLRMQVRDHYVEVVTDKGSELILLRFADALAEVSEAEGLQVHRSHWVAREAMTGLARDRGRTFLLLRDGSSVPVSRPYLPVVEALGLDARAAAAE